MLLLTATLAGLGQGAPKTLPTVHARVATGPITLDGKLTEPDWENAEPIYLTQQLPVPGGANPYRTEVRILISGDALIFGFHCIDPDLSRVVAHTLARDGDMSQDDTISIVLDSFNDKRTGYFFSINESAARTDALVAGLGIANFETEWDGIWDARTARTGDGWTAEIRIPAQTLAFRNGNSRWGLEIDRNIPRDQTELRWASPSLDADIQDMTRTGTLMLDKSLKQGRGLEFAPYASGKMLRDFSFPDANWLGTGGGEVTWRITPQLAAVLTVNTDFAETQVDARQLNVTPFPLYFPEKRAFFLEGANQYVFGLGLGTRFLPFFSRNVGLLDGYNIPLDGGLKLNGHAGKWSLALLDVETRKTWVTDEVVSDLGLASARVEGTNLLASRVAYDLNKELRVSAMVTHGDPEAVLSNTFAGTDAVWHTGSLWGQHALEFGGWAATTQGQVPDGSRQAWGLRFDYPNDKVNCAADTNRFGDGFDPLLGFLPRPATHQTTASCHFRPRPKTDGPFRAIRQADYSVDFSRITDTDGNLQSQTIEIDPVNFTTNSGANLTLRAVLRHETLLTPFAVVPTVSYPVGSFDFQRYGLNLMTSPNKQLRLINRTSVGGYYNGHLYRQYDDLTWAPLHGRVQLEATADNYFGHTPQGKFTEKLWQFQGTVTPNPNLSLNTFVQYDNVSFALSSNTRLQWTFRPGDDFYIIWDKTWQRNITQPGVSFDPAAESLTAKIRWTFRM